MSDRKVLALIAGWLNAGVLVGGSVLHPTAGTPQGGVISPLLANIYLNRLDQAWKEKHRLHGEMTRYADDLVILCGSEGRAEAANAALHSLLADLRLELSEAKTRIADLRQPLEGFDFLGFHFRMVPTRKNPRRKFAARWPSRSAMAAARDRIRELTPIWRIGLSLAVVVKEVNAFLRSWGAYFRRGNSTKQFQSLDQFVFERLARFIARKVKGASRGRGMAVLIDSRSTLRIHRLAGTVRY